MFRTIVMSSIARPKNRAVAVAQLADKVIPTPQILGLNPVTSKIFAERLLTVNCRKDKNKEREALNVPF